MQNCCAPGKCCSSSVCLCRSFQWFLALPFLILNFILSSSLSLYSTLCRVSFSPSHLELQPKLKADGTPLKQTPLNRYAQFVKDHYAETRQQLSHGGHREVMRILQQRYRTDSSHSVSDVDRQQRQLDGSLVVDRNQLNGSITLHD